MKLYEVARLIRSKNAGPFWLTFDVMFDNATVYQYVKESKILNPSIIEEMYSVTSQDLKFFYCDEALAIKFSFPRKRASGSVGDSDVFGGQQYAPLLDIRLDLVE